MLNYHHDFEPHRIISTPPSAMSLLLGDWNEGEDAMHRLLKVPPMSNPSSQGFPAWYAPRLMRSPLVALGTLDDEARPWTTIWGGERGFARPVAEDVIGINSEVDRISDPVFGALWAGHDADGADVVQGGGRLMSGLAIDLETRDRVKLAGTMVAGAVAEGRVQMAMHVKESLGNCPKYLNKKTITPHNVVRDGDGGDAQPASRGLPLGEDALGVLRQADLFFMSTTSGESMDTNHRGGSPGFVRVMQNDEDGVVIVYPECELPILHPTGIWLLNTF